MKSLSSLGSMVSGSMAPPSLGNWGTGGLDFNTPISPKAQKPKSDENYPKDYSPGSEDYSVKSKGSPYIGTKGYSRASGEYVSSTYGKKPSLYLPVSKGFYSRRYPQEEMDKSRYN